MSSTTITKWKLIGLVDCIVESHYEHIQKGPPQDRPYPDHVKKYGKAAEDPIPEDTKKELSKDKKKRVH